MNNLSKRVISIALASALITSVGTTAFAAETNETDSNTIASTQNDAYDWEYDENGNVIIDNSDMATGSKELDPDCIDDEHTISSVADYEEFAGIESDKKNGAVPCASGLPDAVDNSTNENSIYFPPIGDQVSLNSCVGWATTYYVYTYMANKAKGVPTTSDNIYSPIWIYNLTNNGVDSGTWDDFVMDTLKYAGAATINDVPIQTSKTPASNYRSWHAENDIWEHAAHNRITDYAYLNGTYYSNGNLYSTFTPVANFGTPITDAKDSDLDAMKTALNNGDILPISVYINSWNYSTIKSSDDPSVDNNFVGQLVAYQCNGSAGGHQMTLVGYNDNIWTDINNNGQIDNGEMGAFKIANSWGTNRGNDGFYWVAYDALNTVSAVPNFENGSYRNTIFRDAAVYYIEDKDYSSNAFLKYTLNTSNRFDAYVTVKATDKTTGAVYSERVNPYKFSRYQRFPYDERRLNYAGTNGESDGTMYYDLNNLIPDITTGTVSDYNWEITVNAYNSATYDSSVTIKELKFVNSEDGTEYDLTNGTQETITQTTRTYTANDVDLAGKLGLSITTDPESFVAPSAVKLKANAHGGVAPYQYSFEVVHNYHETMIDTGWTSNSYVDLPIDTNGSYKYTVSVKDAEGTVVTENDWDYVSDFTIYDLDTNTGIFSEIEEGNVGQTTTFKPSGNTNSNLLTSSNYKYTITRNGVSTQYTPTNSSDYSLAFTPAEGGCYTVNLKVTYKNKTLADLTETFYVTDGTPANAVKIYYKGYSTPNIHFCPENGSWTSVPGVAMTPDTSVSGCTHSYTIDLGSASYADVCFNDGHGNWDSRNGANYRFTSGVYKFENGNITNLGGGSSNLSASISMPSHVVLRGNKMPISCSATGGTAPYYYKFVKRSINGNQNENVIRNYSSDNTASVTGYTSPAYGSVEEDILSVYVMDSTGKVAKASEDLTNKYLISSLKTDKVSAVAGETVNLSCEVNDTLYNVEYHFYIYDGTDTIMFPSTSENNINWTPTKTGTYTLYVSIYNVNDRFSIGGGSKEFNVTDEPTNTVTIYYKGYSTPNIHYQVGNGSWTAVPGVAMEAANEVSGCTHKYTIDLGDAAYANVCFNDGHGNWDSRNGANYYFTSGVYKFENGNITSLNDTLIPSLTFSKKIIPNGESTDITCSVIGGTAPYTYKFTYYYEGVEQYPGERVLQNTSSDNTVTMSSFFLTGDYTIRAYVTDANGKTAVASDLITYLIP